MTQGKFAKPRSGGSPVLALVRTVFTWLLVIASVFMMVFTIVSVNTFDRNNRSIFGYKAFIVLSDSMSTTQGDASRGYFSAGDLVLVKAVEPRSLAAGDIIAYVSTNSDNYGSTVTHMIRKPAQDAQGQPGFITYGTHTNTDDDAVVTYSQILGKYQFHIPYAGAFFQFLKTTPGYLICILLPFMLLIGIQGLNCVRLFKQYRAEQLAELEAQRQAQEDALEAQRKELEAERSRQEDMMRKLLELQQALEQKGNGGSES